MVINIKICQRMWEELDIYNVELFNYQIIWVFYFFYEEWIMELGLFIYMMKLVWFKILVVY